MVALEVIVSACSGAAAAKSTPAIQLHDLTTFAHVHSFKSSSSALNSLAYVESANGVGGSVWAVQEGKAIAGIWAWQKDQQHLKLHLPERLSCITISPNGVWVAGGSSGGQIYLWEIASGLLLASWNAHYRSVTSLQFTADSALLLSASQDGGAHVFLVRALLDDEAEVYGKPYGSLTDHTLAITDIVLGVSAGAAGGRCVTCSEDGTVKLWSVAPPFDLLATFVLPPGTTPTGLALDPSERFIYAGTADGSVFHIPLFKRKSAMGQVEAVGDGPGGTKLSSSVISVQSPVTTLALSLSADQLLVGTQSGEIHVHALPSHQHLRTLSSQTGPISHLSTTLSPPDLVGRPSRLDEWPIMEIKPLERMRASRAAKDAQEVSIVLKTDCAKLDKLRNIRKESVATQQQQGDTAALEAEVKRLRVALDKAVKLNEKMWSGVVDLKMRS